MGVIVGKLKLLHSEWSLNPSQQNILESVLKLAVKMRLHQVVDNSELCEYCSVNLWTTLALTLLTREFYDFGEVGNKCISVMKR